MESQLAQFKELIGSSSRILVTSHISPDADAVTSLLLVGNTLEANFPNTHVLMVLEEEQAKPTDFLTAYKKIQFGNLLTAVQQLNPDLFIMVDVANFSRSSRNNGPELNVYLKQLGSKTVIIDHHEELGIDKTDVYINHRLPSTAQEIYEIFFEKLNLQKPTGYAETALLGIISDSARFKYDNPGHRKTFNVVSDLLDAGASIEKLENQAERYNKNQLLVFSELLRNISDSGAGYTYSFISDEFTNQWVQNKCPANEIKNGSDLFTNQFLRNYENNLWGVILYPELASGPNKYSAGFRSQNGMKDVSVIAAKLGGGGHKGAAGAKFDAKDINDALKKVQSAIN